MRDVHHATEKKSADHESVDGPTSAPGRTTQVEHDDSGLEAEEQPSHRHGSSSLFAEGALPWAAAQSLPADGEHAHAMHAAPTAKLGHSMRRRWGSGKGSFRTRGRRTSTGVCG